MKEIVNLPLWLVIIGGALAVWALLDHLLLPYQGEGDIAATIHYSSYEFDKNKIDINYFKWFLKSAIFRKIVQAQIKGGIKTELKPKKFLPLEIELPDLLTQKKILEKINNLENEVSQLEKNVSYDETLLKKLRQSILRPLL